MTISEENYIKVIYHLSLVSPKGVNTNAIAGMLDTKASSVTDMMKKLSDKDLVSYQKYQGVTLTEKGLHSAKMIVRKHRLWEVFLCNNAFIRHWIEPGTLLIFPGQRLFLSFGGQVQYHLELTLLFHQRR